MMKLGRLAAGFAVLAGALFSVAAQAAAPMVKTQGPGYFRMMLGDFEITALNDGTVMLPMGDLLTNTTKAKVDAALAHSFLTDPTETSFNAFLVNTGEKLVLIDTGAGKLFGPTLGRMLSALKASGYQPEQVDEIYITHFHGDHIGGLTAGDARAFPNAVVRAHQKEADFWLSKANMDAAPKDRKDSFTAVMGQINPYITAGKFKPFDGAVELVSGVRAVPAPGHTPGHSIYVVESKGQKLVLWGDLMHCAVVQFPDPSVTIKFDSDTKAAEAERRKAYADAAKNGFWVAGAHLSFPGIGHLRAAGSGYTFIPVNYTTLQ